MYSEYLLEICGSCAVCVFSELLILCTTFIPVLCSSLLQENTQLTVPILDALSSLNLSSSLLTEVVHTLIFGELLKAKWLSLCCYPLPVCVSALSGPWSRYGHFGCCATGGPSCGGEVHPALCLSLRCLWGQSSESCPQLFAFKKTQRCYALVVTVRIFCV